MDPEFDGSELGLRFRLAPPFALESARIFQKRERELQQCFACWAVDGETKVFLDTMRPLNFRLEGPPGVGKNEIVYELASQLGRPLYVIQGHEELTPEDLALVLVPNASDGSTPGVGFSYNASPLVSALRRGGLFFFDEINRVPERTLAPLASVLDDRKRIYSALVARDISPPNEDFKASFRFCCAMNPEGSARGGLPDYIDERTLPVIRVDYMSLDDLVPILSKYLNPSTELLHAFRTWYEEDERRHLSTRQARTLVQYAMSIAWQTKVGPDDAIRQSSEQVGIKSKTDDGEPDNDADEEEPDDSDDDGKQ